MKILVTGANGYIGQGVVEALLNYENEVVAIDFSSEHINSKASCLTGDIFNLDDPYSYFGQPDAVVHLAWRDNFKHNSENHINDLPKHYDFLKKLIYAGTKKVAIMGSMHEIGFYEGSINEATPCNPQSLYGISKNALRQAVEITAKENGSIFQWLRGYYIVGNSQYGNSVFSKITQAAAEGKKEFPFTSGQKQFDFINYDLFCKQIASTVMQDEIVGIINCCSGYPEKLADRVERFIRENNYDIKLNYNVFPDRPYDSKAVWGDNSKIKLIMEKMHFNFR